MDIINRNLTIVLNLKETAENFGYKLESDPYDDVYHNGYSSKDIKKMNLSLPEKYSDVDKIFPSQVAMALESSEREGYCTLINKRNKEALVDCLMKIDLSGGGVEYTSVEGIQVSTKASITKVTINEAEETIAVEINNPEHLINAILSGAGYFAPELSAVTIAKSEEITSRFHHLKDFFEIYGESKPSAEISNQVSPDFNEDFFNSELEFRLTELDLDEVSEAVKSYNQEEISEAMNLAEKYTDYSKKDIAQNLISTLETDLEQWKSLLKHNMG